MYYSRAIVFCFSLNPIMASPNMEWQSMKSKSSGYESEGTKILKCSYVKFKNKIKLKKKKKKKKK